MKFNKSFLFLMAVVVLVSVGCHRRPVPEGMPKLSPCKIHVTQAGQPLVGATVQLASADLANPGAGLPTQVANKWSAAGQTDETGTAIMMTRGFKGAAAGDWVVTVTKEEVETDAEAGTTTFYSCVAPEYGSVRTTPFTLSTNGNTEETFDVGDEYREVIRQLAATQQIGQ